MFMTWELQSKKDIYKNPWIEVTEEIIIDHLGKEKLYGMVAFQEGCCVLPIDEKGNVYLAAQYRYGADKRSIEAPGGAIDPGEDAQTAAKRELAEELGITPERWIDCGYVNPLTSILRHKEHLFIAKGFEPIDHAPKNEEEDISLVVMSLEEATQKVLSGEMTHAPTCTVILKAALLEKDSA